MQRHIRDRLSQLRTTGPLHDQPRRQDPASARSALAAYGAPEQILTDNGKVFTARFNHPPVEVLFDAICRENGIGHL